MAICGIMSLIGSILMFGFPEQLAGENHAYLREMMEDAMVGWRIPAYANENWTKDVGDGPLALFKRMGVSCAQNLFLFCL